MLLLYVMLLYVMLLCVLLYVMLLCVKMMNGIEVGGFKRPGGQPENGLMNGWKSE